MTTRSSLSIVLGVDEGILEGRTLRWAGEQAHVEGGASKLVMASGAVSAAQRDYGMGPSAGQLGRTQPSVPPGPGQGSELRLTAPYVDVDQIFQVADPSTLLMQLLQLRSPRGARVAGEGAVRSHHRWRREQS